MKKTLLFILFAIAVLCPGRYFVIAENVDQDSSRQELSTNVEEIIDHLDTTDIENVLGELTEEQKGLFGGTSFKDRLVELAMGEGIPEFENFWDYLFNLFFGDLIGIVPFIVSILSICIIFSIINSIKGKFATESTESIVRFVTVSLIATIIFAQTATLLASVKDVIYSFKNQMDSVFPVLLTIMTGMGEAKNVALYQPAIAVLSGGLSEIVVIFALPCFILSMAFSVIGSLSDGVNLKNLSGFFGGALKWTLGTAFFVFLAFLSIRGVTAATYDSIYIRTTKLALSRYVPIIGGYLSEGYNLVVSGSVLIKNGVGLGGIILLIVTVLPIVIRILMFSLSLKFCAAICEPIAGQKTGEMLNSISKSVGNLVSIVLGIAFLYFIFLLLVIYTGNYIV